MMRGIRLTGCWLGLLAGAAAVTAETSPAAAQPVVAPVIGRHAGAMVVPVNKSQVLKVDKPFAQLLVGNPEIADVMPLTSQSLYVLGKKTGSTSLTIYDGQKRLVAVLDLVVGPDNEGLKRQLFELMPNEQIGVRVSNDSLILSGTVSSAAAVSRAASIAETYAPGKVVNTLSVGAVQQVMLEVRFSEMRRETAKQLGFRASFSDGDFDFLGATGIAPVIDNFGTLGANFSIGDLNVSIALDALEKKGLITTLAEPTLIALSGETASFLAGGEFPIPVARRRYSNDNEIGGEITVEFKEFGVGLGFTPTVLEDGIINLVVAPEVSRIDPNASINLNGLIIPGLQTRRAKTTLELRDGQSFAIAGLIRNDFEDTVRQFPVLGSLPIIGSLFRSSGFKKEETELVMIVTPRLVRPAKPEDLKVPTDRVRPPSELDLFLMGSVDDIKSLRPNGQAVSAREGGIDGQYGYIVR